MDNKDLLDLFNLWKSWDIHFDVLFQPEFKEIVDKIKAEFPEIEKSEIVQKVEQCLSQ